jgi:hypothetical protein
MTATRDDIRGWLMQGKRDGATHVIIVCDTFDWEDYPVYVQPGVSVEEEIAKYDNKNMQKVMEVYNLALLFGPQLSELRAWHV